MILPTSKLKVIKTSVIGPVMVNDDPNPFTDLSLKSFVPAFSLKKVNHSPSFSSNQVSNIDPLPRSENKAVHAHLSSLS